MEFFGVGIGEYIGMAIIVIGLMELFKDVFDKIGGKWLALISVGIAGIVIAFYFLFLPACIFLALIAILRLAYGALVKLPTAVVEKFIAKQ